MARRKNIFGVEEGGNMADPSTQHADIKQLRDLKATRTLRDQGAPQEAVSRRFKEITGRPIDVVPTNLPFEDLRAQREAQSSVGFTPPASPAIGSTPAVGTGTTAPAVAKPAYTTPGRTGVFVNNRELPRRVGGGVAMPPSAMTRDQETTSAATAVVNAGLQEDPAAMDVALAKVKDPNQLGIGEARVVAPSGQVIGGNADQMAASTNAMQNYRPNRVGRTGAGGGIVISNQVDRPSGVIGKLPIMELTKGGLSGPRFALRPRKGVEEAGVVAQGAIGAINAKGGYDERIARNQTDAARANADAARVDAGLDRTSKEKIAQGANEAAVKSAEAKVLTASQKIQRGVERDIFMTTLASYQKARDAEFDPAKKQEWEVKIDALDDAYKAAVLGNPAPNPSAGGAAPDAPVTRSVIGPDGKPAVLTLVNGQWK